MAAFIKEMISLLLFAAALALPPQAVEEALAGRSGAYVQIECATGESYRSDPAACAEKLGPCSTFKIWNAAIGLETGIVANPDAPFWKWDGVKREMVAEWNQDQTLRSAFAISCVPAYQALARKIGAERMKQWIETIGYGDRNMSSGLDVFWLPEPGRQTLLISADEQAALMARLATGKVPFSEKTQAQLADVMKAKATEKGVLYGKTGTGSKNAEGKRLGWYVGYVKSGGKTYAFACWLQAEGIMGKDARAVVESLLTEQGCL